MFCWYSWHDENMHSPVYLYVQDSRMVNGNLEFCGEGLSERAWDGTKVQLMQDFAPSPRCAVDSLGQ